MNKQEFAKVVQAWADGESIQWSSCSPLRVEWGSLSASEAPNWDNVQLYATSYRIRPKDVIEHRYTYSSWASPETHMADVKLTFTNGKLTNAEVLE